VFNCFSLFGHEGLAVANPKGGQKDVEVMTIKNHDHSQEFFYLTPRSPSRTSTLFLHSILTTY